MNKITAILTSVLMMAVFAFLPVSASAQMSNTMPALYNESGDQVNDESGTKLSAGYYFLDSDASADSRVYYFGNGTFYNANTGTYGGHISNPNGTAGVTFADMTPVITPGVPNTGTGGPSLILILTLVLSGILAVTGLTYIASERHSSRM
jgi:hypothetical protein